MRAVVFISGAVLMSLEMLASRILAPAFGNSIFVWGSLISVFLASLAVGYAVGGKLADHRPSLRMLALIMAIPGVLTLILPWFYEPVNNALAAYNLGPRFGPLLASLVLFFVPSVFMGMVSPFAIKLQVKGLDTVGNTAGSLYAVSTLGSITGTLGTSFFLITWLGVKAIVHLLGVVLLVLAVIISWVARRASRQPSSTVSQSKPTHQTKPNRNSLHMSILAALLALTAASVGTSAASVTVSQKVYEKDSLYHHITVVDDVDGLRYLKFDNSWQSAMSLATPNKLMFPYTEFFHLGSLLRPSAKSALLIGLGGGSIPKNFRVNYPALAMDVAEIDPDVIAVAKRYFSVQDNDKLHLYARDGRIFLKQTKNKYDIVFMDAYYADAIPFHLATTEFLAELSARMTSDGIVVANVIGAVSGARSRIFRSMLKTYQEVFPRVVAFSVGKYVGQTSDDQMQNIILVGLKTAKEPNWKDLSAQAKAKTAQMKVPSDLVRILSYRITTPVTLGDVPVLTDDYAPVDSLLHF